MVRINIFSNVVNILGAQNSGRIYRQYTRKCKCQGFTTKLGCKRMLFP